MSTSIPIYFVDADQLNRDYSEYRAWLEASGFTGEAGTHCLLPAMAEAPGQVKTGGVAAVLVGKTDSLDTWALGTQATTLPPAAYHLGDVLSSAEATRICLGWRLGQYQFNRYKSAPPRPLPELQVPENADLAYIQAAVEATFLVRDLINTPAGDMGPVQLEIAASQLANTYEADFQAIVGEALLTQHYPMIHAVGRASYQEPRLLDLLWGNPEHPQVTLVGKGVCFDTGGLDIKPASGMLTMKKDMGGAAHVLGLALMIMQLQVPVRLRVLIPAVENSIAGNALHPLDILASRQGLTVEVGNTDAEGRLVLADALWEACSDTPRLLVDFATLTGAARVALGTELPAFFCNHEATQQALSQSSLLVDDPLWQLPLHKPYRALLDSKVADMSNISSGSYGGAITAALFLQEFVKSEIPWVHIDLMAWNIRSLPGRPEGGEAMGLRALFEHIRQLAATR